MIIWIGNLIWKDYSFVRVCYQRWHPFIIDHSPSGIRSQGCESPFTPSRKVWMISMLDLRKVKSYASSYFDSSMSAFISLKPLKKQKTKWLFCWTDKDLFLYCNDSEPRERAERIGLFQVHVFLWIIHIMSPCQMKHLKLRHFNYFHLNYF